jgi:hypothetical protein
MNKVTFWLSTDVFWYVFYLLLTYDLFSSYWQSLRLTGDSRIAFLVWIGCFVLINGIFIISQNINSIAFARNSDNNIRSFLNRKILLFLCQNILLFFCESYFYIIVNFSSDPNAPKWLAKFVLYFVLTTAIYWVMIIQMGRNLERSISRETDS